MPEPDSTERVWKGNVLAVTVEHWGDAVREIVERADAAAVVAVDDEGRVVLIRQFREVARSTLVEIPAGVVEAGEDPLATAQRELREETGFAADRWRAGPVVYPTPGFCRERIHLFFADGLTAGAADPQGGERIETERWTADEVSARLTEIKDGKTLAGLLLFLRERS